MRTTASVRRLRDLDGVGPATMRDFAELGVRDVDQLARQDPKELYDRLCRLKGKRVDPCCLDGFTCAIAQARDPHLPKEQRQWWYWSRLRIAANRNRK
jgi:nucleotidyltransferase/DNA polymerase involved in DNA repair